MHTPRSYKSDSSTKEDVCFPFRASRRSGTALVTVVIFLALGTIMLGAVLVWATTLGRLSARRGEWDRTQYVAEAAVEKVFAGIRDSVNSTGQSPTQTTLNTMTTNQLPKSTDNAGFSSYTFLNSSGTSGKVTVMTNGVSSMSKIASGTYAGFNAQITPYRIIARAYSSGRQPVLTNGIQRDIQIQQIPIFQFAIFYNLDMEIENGPPMTVGGKVHSNKNGYFAPNTTLTFNDTVTTALSAYPNPMPGDTHQTSWNSPTYTSPVTQNVPNLNLPISTNASPSIATNYHALIELPPTSGTDPIASTRLYNQAGLQIKVTNSGITAKLNGNTVTMKSGIVTTTATIFDFRENSTVAITDIDLSKLQSQNQVPANGIVYVADTRTGSSYQETAVRLINGDSLPAAGLTVITQNPLYILGNYNSVYDAPASIFADAINILSPVWSDSNSSKDISTRVAQPSTVDAAFFAGIVPTSFTGSNPVTAHYSGGVENFPRFLEDWSNATFTYNGSMVAMFPSQTADGLWETASYSPPNRNWAFDVQFLNPSKLPPGTPQVRTIRRTTWVPTT